jgi:hypothetical protein
VKQQDNSETDNLSVIIGDLRAQKAEEIKGRPSLTESLTDLPVDDSAEIKSTESIEISEDAILPSVLSVLSVANSSVLIR